MSWVERAILRILEGLGRHCHWLHSLAFVFLVITSWISMLGADHSSATHSYLAKQHIPISTLVTSRDPPSQLEGSIKPLILLAALLLFITTLHFISLRTGIPHRITSCSLLAPLSFQNSNRQNLREGLCMLLLSSALCFQNTTASLQCSPGFCFCVLRKGSEVGTMTCSIARRLLNKHETYFFPLNRKWSARNLRKGTLY